MRFTARALKEKKILRALFPRTGALRFIGRVTWHDYKTSMCVCTHGHPAHTRTAALHPRTRARCAAPNQPAVPAARRPERGVSVGNPCDFVQTGPFSPETGVAACERPGGTGRPGPRSRRERAARRKAPQHPAPRHGAAPSQAHGAGTTHG